MPSKALPVVPLCEMQPGIEVDCFALLTVKEELTTRDGKAYFKVTFRDARREVSFPIWGDSLFANDCREQWRAGQTYKLRAIYRETSYGPQLDVRKIRETIDADDAEGCSPAMFLPSSRFPSQQMFEELVQLAERHIDDVELRQLVLGIYRNNKDALLMLPAATRNHHAFVGGYLEHVLSVTRTCLFLAQKYSELYPNMQPPLNVGLVVAGGMLHDIGKLREYELTPAGAQYSAAGRLIGHILQGRDIVREAAAESKLPEETLLRLEHIIVSHQRLPEWGSPKPPMTPEALLVHYADDVDAKFEMMYAALRDDPLAGPLTSNKNSLYQQVYRGGA